MVVNAWHPANAAVSTLPPCHYTFVVNVQDGRLNLHLTQRSGDIALGVPFNIAAYALLANALAQRTGFEIGEFGHTVVDAHIYCGRGDRGQWYANNLRYVQDRLATVESKADYLDVKSWVERTAPDEADGEERYDHVPGLLEQLAGAARATPDRDRRQAARRTHVRGHRGRRLRLRGRHLVRGRGVMAGDASAGGDADAADGTDIDLVLVAAVAENRVIGDDGGMPWHYPADLARFKRLTTGHPVIVGRATYESIADRIGGPLPDRTSVVLTTRDLDLPEGAVVANDLDEAVDLAGADAADRGVDDVYVIGGATVYEQFLDRADRMVLTEVPEQPDGDTRFPDWDDEEWVETEREVVGADGERGGEADALAFVTYERVDG